MQDNDATEKEMWVLILEKAWAKLHGSYESTAAGLTADTLVSAPHSMQQTRTIFQHDGPNRLGFWSRTI